MSAPARRTVAWICFAVAMIDGYDTLMLSFIAPLISKEWALSAAGFGRLFAISYAGAALGATVTGFAADRWGRKKLLLIALTISGVFTLACAGAANASQLMLCRAISGFGLGGAIPAISALTAAHAPEGQRSAAVTRMFVGYPIGALAGGAATAAAMTYAGWRGIFVSAGFITCCLIPVVVLWLAEGPREARRLSGGDRTRHPLSELIADQRAGGTVMLCLASFMVLLVTYFLVSWTPTVLTLNGVSPPTAALSGVVLNCGGLIGAWLLSWIMAQPRALQIVAACLMIGSLLIGMLGQGVIDADGTGFFMVFGVGLFVIGAQLNLAAISVKYYPQSVCATGVGLSMSCGRVGSIAGPLIGGYLVSAEVGWNRLFLLAAIPALLAGAALWALSLLQERSRADVLRSAT
ncbi:MAG TPA: MFS transporter [Steroidobacteraceae bacterium]|jgi:AAHS family 4-hydroxybenzoate transporter-like MFS transporter|nr:MFS transporter [Steroidobacteraceae bacterium]